MARGSAAVLDPAAVIGGEAINSNGNVHRRCTGKEVLKKRRVPARDREARPLNQA
jgi:hypothetical protein